jgi:hypothetical protein
MSGKPPVFTILSIASCIGLPLGTSGLFRSSTGDRFEEAIATLLGLVAGALLGLVFAIIGLYRKEQPRWLNWIALLLLGALALLGARFVV